MARQRTGARRRPARRDNIAGLTPQRHRKEEFDSLQPMEEEDEGLLHLSPESVRASIKQAMVEGELSPNRIAGLSALELPGSEDQSTPGVFDREAIAKVTIGLPRAEATVPPLSEPNGLLNIRGARHPREEIDAVLRGEIDPFLEPPSTNDDLVTNPGIPLPERSTAVEHHILKPTPHSPEDRLSQPIIGPDGRFDPRLHNQIIENTLGRLNQGRHLFEQDTNPFFSNSFLLQPSSDLDELNSSVINTLRSEFGDELADQLSSVMASGQARMQDDEPQLIQAGAPVIPVVLAVIRSVGQWWAKRTAKQAAKKTAQEAAKKSAQKSKHFKKKPDQKQRKLDDDDWPKPEGKTNKDIGEIMGWGKGLDGARAWIEGLKENAPTLIKALVAVGFTKEMARRWRDSYRKQAKENKDKGAGYEQFEERAKGLQWLIDLWPD